MYDKFSLRSIDSKLQSLLHQTILMLLFNHDYVCITAPNPIFIYIIKLLD